MVPSKLQRHLVTNHPSLSTKDKSYFERSLSSKIKQVKVFEKQVCESEKAQVASYEIAELIAVNLKPHNLSEEIILPACRKIVKTMIGGSADIDICKIPLSNDTIHCRIKDMSENIEQNTAKTLANSNFALQVDETTDITGNAQLIAFVRFIHENDIINQFFYVVGSYLILQLDNRFKLNCKVNSFRAYSRYGIPVLKPLTPQLVSVQSARRCFSSAFWIPGQHHGTTLWDSPLHFLKRPALVFSELFSSTSPFGSPPLFFFFGSPRLLEKEPF
ncbi:SCAN domain-containing protein 3 [Trichonephila clavipes]|nr:SCAN domain-containing protein 3 [Trichonephila clavipes]